jgi:hypothetical protein
MSNLPGGMIRSNPDGSMVLGLPIPTTSPMPLLDTEDDTGKFVKGILLHREETLGKQILGAWKYLTPAEIVEEVEDVFPESAKGIKAVEIPHGVFKDALAARGLPELGQEDLLQNMRLMPEFGYYMGKPLEPTQSILVDPLTTWKDFVKKSPIYKNFK